MYIKLQVAPLHSASLISSIRWSQGSMSNLWLATQDQWSPLLPFSMLNVYYARLTCGWLRTPAMWTQHDRQNDCVNGLCLIMWTTFMVNPHWSRATLFAGTPYTSASTKCTRA